VELARRRTDRLTTHLSMSEGDPEWGEHVSDSEHHGQD
jgi:hypothetical protein